MSRRIPQSFIDEIISRADIVDVVGRRVSLKRAGANMKGLCPFHDEKTPSFTVSPAKGFYHCFGCMAHGNAIGFLMEHDNMSFPEAVESLADTLGLPMPERFIEDTRPETKELGELMLSADRLFRQSLKENPVAIDYLKQRGIDGPTAARFGIGFAPDSWNTVLRELGGSDARARQLHEAGLLRRNEEGRYYDYFRDRIMFPIRDARGRVIGFGGRVLGSGEPKYLNSPETPLFSKGQALYGIFEARQAGARPDRVLVVEGYLDVVSLAQHGIGPTVATLGTATTAEHIRRLTRLSEKVVFCFDGDAAGRKAAWRAMETALPFGGGAIELKFLMLPNGEDPDSLVRAGGSEAFEGRIDQALTLSEFFLAELKRDIDLSSADGRARMIAAAKPLLAQLPDGMYRELLVRQLAELIGLGFERLSLALQPSATVSISGPRRGPPAARKPSLIQRALTLLVHYPEIAANIPPVEGLSELELPGGALLQSLLELASSNPDLTTAHLIERFRDDAEGKYLKRLVIREPLDDRDAAAAVLRDCLERIVADERRRRAADAIRDWQPAADR